MSNNRITTLVEPNCANAGLSTKTDPIRAETERDGGDARMRLVPVRNGLRSACRTWLIALHHAAEYGRLLCQADPTGVFTRLQHDWRAGKCKVKKSL
jgi:hypothetical protein